MDPCSSVNTVTYDLTSTALTKDLLGHVFSFFKGDDLITYSLVCKVWHHAMIASQCMRLCSLNSLININATLLKNRQKHAESNLVKAIQIETAGITTLPHIELHIISVMEKLSLLLDIPEEEIETFTFELKKNLNPFIDLFCVFLRINSIRKRNEDEAAKLRKIIVLLRSTYCTTFFKVKVYESKEFVELDAHEISDHFLSKLIEQLAGERFYNSTLKLFNQLKNSKDIRVVTKTGMYIAEKLLEDGYEGRAIELLTDLAEPGKTITFIEHVPYEMEKWKKFFGGISALVSSIQIANADFFCKNPAITNEVVAILEITNNKKMAQELLERTKFF